MKLKVLWLLGAFFAASAMHAQAPPPSASFVQMDQHCREVHPGDTVTYSLTVEGLPVGQTVLADLQMRPRHELPLRGKGLPVPDFHNLGGGGLGQPNASSQSTYDFSFVVPKEIFSGRYRGVEVMVKANTPITTADASRYMAVSRHTMKRVHDFCLSVISSYGVPEEKPEVTNFQSGAIVPKQ